jgi:hypothetical protein
MRRFGKRLIPKAPVVAPDDKSSWADAISRSVLYRVCPAFPEPGGESGKAVCMLGTDGFLKVIGFQSFAQHSHHVQDYEAEGSELWRGVKEGKVVFYGAFGVPEALSSVHEISS